MTSTPPYYEVYGFHSKPDKYSRRVQITRRVYPREGSLKNDTVYSPGITWQSGQGSYSGQHLQGTPKTELGAPFDTWEEYFKYLDDLRIQKLFQEHVQSRNPQSYKK